MGLVLCFSLFLYSARDICSCRLTVRENEEVMCVWMTGLEGIRLLGVTDKSLTETQREGI